MKGDVIRFRGRSLPLKALRLDSRDMSELLDIACCRVDAAPDTRKAAWRTLKFQRALHGTLARARQAAQGFDFTADPGDTPKGAA